MTTTTHKFTEEQMYNALVATAPEPSIEFFFDDYHGLIYITWQRFGQGEDAQFGFGNMDADNNQWRFNGMTNGIASSVFEVETAELTAKAVWLEMVTILEKETRFKKLMGQNLNGWMWNFAHALPYVADLVIEGKIALDAKSDVEILAKPFDTEDCNGEDIFGILHFFIMLSTNPLDLDSLGIDQEELDLIGMNSDDLEMMFADNPKKAAQFIKSAQEDYSKTATSKIGGELK